VQTVQRRDQDDVPSGWWRGRIGTIPCRKVDLVKVYGTAMDAFYSKSFGPVDASYRETATIHVSTFAYLYFGPNEVLRPNVRPLQRQQSLFCQAANSMAGDKRGLATNAPSTYLCHQKVISGVYNGTELYKFIPHSSASLWLDHSTAGGPPVTWRLTWGPRVGEFHPGLLLSPRPVRYGIFGSSYRYRKVRHTTASPTSRFVVSARRKDSGHFRSG